MLLSAGTVSSPHHPGLQPWVWFKIVPAFADVPRMLPVQSEDGLQRLPRKTANSACSTYLLLQRKESDLLRKHK